MTSRSSSYFTYDKPKYEISARKLQISIKNSLRKTTAIAFCVKIYFPLVEKRKTCKMYFFKKLDSEN